MKIQSFEKFLEKDKYSLFDERVALYKKNFKTNTYRGHVYQRGKSWLKA